MTSVGLKWRFANVDWPPGVHVLRMLVQQESKIGSRLMGRSDGQEHLMVPSAAPPSSIGENTSFAAWLMVLD
jgi:hypothetical protein